MIRLAAPDTSLIPALAACLEDYGATSIDGSGYPPGEAPARDPEALVADVGRRLREEDESVPPEEGRVNASYRWIMDGEEMLGFIALRHELNAFLHRLGGHIGYSVRPSARRRGVATAALRLMLAEAAERGIDPVLVTCDVDNVGSRRTIERCGGVLENEIDGKLRFWIGDGAPSPRPLGVRARHLPRYPASMRYGFLGPETTFTHQALLQVLAEQQVPGAGASAGESSADAAGRTPGTSQSAPQEPVLVPCTSVAEATAQLVGGELDAIMVPIENSVEGGVSGTLDALAANRRITIVAEQIVPIAFVLAAREGTALTDVTAVASHPHALAQVQGWVRENLPGADVEPASSTAAAARALAELPLAEARGRAAVCPELAADHYGLTVLARGIEDTIGAQTRFVLVTRNGRIPARTGADKTTLVVHLPHNRAGALLDMLELFRANGVNLSRIESRPIGDALGRYSFSIDAEGHLEDRRMAAVMRALHRVCPVVHYLGSYPRADGARPAVTETTADGAYDDARIWVDRLSEMITTADDTAL